MLCTRLRHDWSAYNDDIPVSGSVYCWSSWNSRKSSFLGYYGSVNAFDCSCWHNLCVRSSECGDARFHPQSGPIGIDLPKYSYHLVVLGLDFCRGNCSCLLAGSLSYYCDDCCPANWTCCYVKPLSWQSQRVTF